MYEDAASYGVPPAGADLKGMPEARMQLEDLESQWFRLTGGEIPITQDILTQMAYAGVASLFEFGQFMANVVLKDPSMSTYAPILQIHPGLAYGMDDDSFSTQRQNYQDTYFQLTGQEADKGLLQQAFQKPGLTAADYKRELESDQNIQKTYGWVKYGMSYNDFKVQQESQPGAYGKNVGQDQMLEIIRQQHEKVASGGDAVMATPTKKKTDLSQGSSAVR